MKIKIRMASICRETLDLCMSGVTLMKSMERGDSCATRAEMVNEVGTEWMEEGPSAPIAPKSIGADPRSSLGPPRDESDAHKSLVEWLELMSWSVEEV